VWSDWASATTPEVTVLSGLKDSLGRPIGGLGDGEGGRRPRRRPSTPTAMLACPQVEWNVSRTKIFRGAAPIRAWIGRLADKIRTVRRPGDDSDYFGDGPEGSGGGLRWGRDADDLDPVGELHTQDQFWQLVVVIAPPEDGRSCEGLRDSSPEQTLIRRTGPTQTARLARQSPFTSVRRRRASARNPSPQQTPRWRKQDSNLRSP
jgi:hypothetical protein